MRKRIALLTGGTSSERAVALRSAVNVRAALEESYDVTQFDFPSQIDSFLATRKTFDAAVPVFHGVGGEDGTIQGLLETLGVPYIFSRPRAHAIGIDKAKTKYVAGQINIATPSYELVRRGANCSYSRPSVVKPNLGGSSIGVALVRDAETLAAMMAQRSVADGELLVEDLVEGDEVTVAVVDDGDTVALPPILIRPKAEFFNVEVKYNPDLVDEVCPAPIDAAIAQELTRGALAIHTAIGCRHLSRSDFIVDAAGRIWFLEINTIPGITDASLVPKAIAASGRRLSELLRGWVESVT